jgi:hypothetical protein
MKSGYRSTLNLSACHRLLVLSYWPWVASHLRLAHIFVAIKLRLDVLCSQRLAVLVRRESTPLSLSEHWKHKTCYSRSCLFLSRYTTAGTSNPDMVQKQIAR